MKTAARKTWRIAALSVALAGALLIWVRLRIVSNVPRSVYADPPAQRGPEQK